MNIGCLTCKARLRLFQSYQDLRLWPKNQSGTEIALNSEGWWRDCSLLSSGNGSDKGSWREKREIQRTAQKFWTIFSSYYSKHVFFFHAKRWNVTITGLAVKALTSLLQYNRAVPLWLSVAHLVKLMTWSRCLLRELTSSCCFFKLSSWSLVRA